MKTKIIEQNKEKTIILLTDVEVPLINALRRTCIVNVPTMAIEDVEITKNTSALYDEIIAQRLGLISIITDYSYKNRKECKCKGEGCSRCQVTLSFDKVGPCNVYASDFKTSDPNVKPVNPETLIVYLGEGQEISLEAKTQLGIGREHAKWGPGLAYHRFYPIIKINTKKISKNSKNIVQSCPKHVLDWKDNKLVINKKNLEKCDLCNACVKTSENGEIKVEPDKTQVYFTFESWGQLPAKTVFDKALTVINDQLKELKQ